MTGDHHGQSTERATLLARGVDAILGTHKLADTVAGCEDGLATS
jgi:hypothetical protein